jgi:deoxyribodipyrimidine photo-lyase
MTTTQLDHRIHAPADTRPRPGGEFVLYWMQATMRAHDNFALNFAIEQANALDLPVVVYHGLRHDYPWASDRFHTWILESVVDLYADFEALGIPYGFWLDTSNGKYTEWPAGASGAGRAKSSGTPTALVALARRARLVVTDFFPTFIQPRQLKGLRGKIEAPVIAVESATVVPMQALEKEYSTARAIRPVLMEALPHYLWQAPAPEPRVRRAVDLGFEPVRPRAATIPKLVADCDIDHSVPPSPAFRGGTRAGRGRLAEFLRHGLSSYTDDRNDPNKPDAVSRLSPWLHFGNLSIHEILLAARDAGPADQYAKFLDEALTWRELAHNFCYFNPKHRTVSGIPAWAREQLRNHESDPRPHLYTPGEMEAARTGEELWNAAQRSYLRDGWMHNYMRMLWGKTVLQWTPSAAEALRVLEHLNNKYSLDGRDPNSYGGIMWIFGKFDRPFYRRPIYGTVRYQSLRAARDKFDVDEYVRRFRD